LVLTEDDAFEYNVSVNVSDQDDDPMVFYYEKNDLDDFCSFNSTTFDYNTGLIIFTPTDCDVGYHNITIIASDLKLNSTPKSFNFTVNNVVDDPLIDGFTLNSNTILEGYNKTMVSSNAETFVLYIEDQDFLVPDGQIPPFYNESLTVDVTATNTSSGLDVDLFNLSYAGFGSEEYLVKYNVSFSPTLSQAGNYTVFINITDNSGNLTNRSFGLNISESTNPPVLNDSTVVNRSLTFHDLLNFTANASDDEDDVEGINLTYAIYNLSMGAPNLTIGATNGSVVRGGEILVDGKNIKNFKQESLRNEMAIVPQECVLFDDTIWNNIKFSNPGATKDEVRRAIRFAQLDKIIEEMPQKESTIVGERGVKLSGGEKQRVSIARAILANKKILVLDEATSSLDSETEHDIQADLAKLMKGRTSIIIAHRLSTIMHADKIIVMKKGKIVQSGTHRQLINQKGEYKKLWNLQKGGYIK